MGSAERTRPGLLGIDAGTSGCKIAVFSYAGEMLASAYRAYDAAGGDAGRAELDAAAVWEAIYEALGEVTALAPGVAIKALSVSSLGEAVVPVTAARQILGPSILNFDARGAQFLAPLAGVLPAERLYGINGNTLGNHYSLTKLKWIQRHQPALYERTYKFLPWGAFIAFMLGGEAAVDYSLANRTLLFDLRAETWSDQLLEDVGLDGEKLPRTVPAGTVIGRVAASIAAELGWSQEVAIVAGAHDQCANALGCGVIEAGSAVYGMGTFHCITPVFERQPAPQLMMAQGLNTEHHAVPDRYVSFIYNQGGSLVKWFRQTFAAAEYEAAVAAGKDIYPALLAEMPAEPSTVLVLPHFTTTGPPEFIADSAGVIAGLRLHSTRGDILKGIIEGAAYYLKEVVDGLPAAGIEIADYRAAGGGSRSDTWVQTCADIFGQAITRPVITEAGALGAAIVAGVGSGVFNSYAEGVEQMVKLECTFAPDPRRHEQYQNRYEDYRQMWPLLGDYLRSLGG